MPLERLYRPAKIVEQIIEELVGSEVRTLYSEPYQNGRERGFAFWCTRGADGVQYPYGFDRVNTVFVCENRNSDDLKLIPAACNGDYRDVTEGDYAHAEFFAPLCYHQAALRVLALLGSPRPWSQLTDDPEPPHDDAVLCCPDCETPNQFGELCRSCQIEIQREAIER